MFQVLMVIDFLIIQNKEINFVENWFSVKIPILLIINKSTENLKFIYLTFFQINY